MNNGLTIAIGQAIIWITCTIYIVDAARLIWKVKTKAYITSNTRQDRIKLLFNISINDVIPWLEVLLAITSLVLVFIKYLFPDCEFVIFGSLALLFIRPVKGSWVFSRVSRLSAFRQCRHNHQHFGLGLQKRL